MKCPFELPVKKEKLPKNTKGIDLYRLDRVLFPYTQEEADYIVTAINSHEKYKTALEKIRDTETHDDEDCDPYGALGICKDTARDVLEKQ